MIEAHLTPESRDALREWQTKTAADIADDIRAALAGIPKARWQVVELTTPSGVRHVWVTSGCDNPFRETGQDRRFTAVKASRPFEDYLRETQLLAAPAPDKVPPVVRHAPPRLRGRWARG